MDVWERSICDEDRSTRNNAWKRDRAGLAGMVLCGMSRWELRMVRAWASGYDALVAPPEYCVDETGLRHRDGDIWLRKESDRDIFRDFVAGLPKWAFAVDFRRTKARRGAVGKASGLEDEGVACFRRAEDAYRWDGAGFAVEFADRAEAEAFSARYGGEVVTAHGLMWAGRERPSPPPVRPTVASWCFVCAA